MKPRPSGASARPEKPPKSTPSSLQATFASSVIRGLAAPAAQAARASASARTSGALIAGSAPRLHCGGRSASRSGGFGGGFGAFGSGGSSASVTHQTASAQPSPGGIGSGSTQPGPGGQFSRTWKWSWWFHQGRTLRSQPASPRPAVRQSASLTGAVTKMRSTRRSRAAASISAACDGVQLRLRLRWSPSAHDHRPEPLALGAAEVEARSAGVYQMSMSSPVWWLAWPFTGPPRGWLMSPT